MKIKEVCTRTGLTDRTVRYYIEEGLIAPSYTENYLGRKAFEFSEDDIGALGDIAILRSYGFSVEEIRTLLREPEKSPSVIKAVKERTGENVTEAEKRLAVLQRLDESVIYTVASLARAIETPVSTDPPVENAPKTLTARKILRTVLSLGAVWLPIAVGAPLFLIRLIAAAHPVINPWLISVLLLSFLPSVCALLPIKAVRRGMRRQALLGACAVCIPLSILLAIGSVGECAHTWGDFSTRTAATCAHEGTLVRSCKDCGATDTAEVAVLPHSLIIERGYAATCHTHGKTVGQYCTECRTYVVEPHIIPKLSHAYSDPYYVPATCSMGGGTARRCLECNHLAFFETELPNNLHNFKAVQFVDEELGSPAIHGEDYYRCTSCGMEACEVEDLNDTVHYYITGDVHVGSGRVMTIYGTGSMPNFTPLTPAPWHNSPYLEEVTKIVIESGVTSVGEYAFQRPLDGSINPYRNVSLFSVRSEQILLPEDFNGISAIPCGITYEAFYKRYHSPEAVSAFLYFLESESFYKGGDLTWGSPDLTHFALFDVDGDGREELILRTGTCAADSLAFVYTYRENAVTELGYVGAAHAEIYGIGNDTGLILYTARQGYEDAVHLRIAQNALETEPLLRAPDAESLYDPDWISLTWFELTDIYLFGGKG